MRKKPTLINSCIFLIIFCHAFSYSQTAEVCTEKNEIRRLHNDVSESYRRLKIKMETAEQLEYLNELKSVINDYYALAQTLEKRGQYQEAQDCYKKILDLTNSPWINSYITQKNAELKELAEQSRKSLVSKIFRKRKGKVHKEPTRKERMEELLKKIKTLEERRSLTRLKTCKG